jgi:hypothetical protein
MKLYLRPKSAEEPTFYNIIKHVEPTRVNKLISLSLFQETIFQLVLK